MATSTERIVYDIVAHDRNAKKTFDETAKSVDKAGKSFEHLGKDSESLDQRISQTRGHLRGLIAEFENTGDKTLFRDIRKDRSTLSLLQSLRKEITGIGDDSDKTGKKIEQAVVGGVGDGLGSIPSELKGAAIVAGVGIAAIMAPEIGAIIGGAVLGGVGLGGIVGGIALAAQDDRVRQAASKVGDNLMEGLQRAAKPFVAPLIDALDTLDAAGARFTADLGKDFSKLAPLLKPLSKGLAGFVDELGSGLSAAVDAALPAVRAIAQELPALGESIGGALSEIADSGQGATEGLITLFHVVEEGITYGADFVSTLADIYDGLLRAANATSGFVDKYLGWFPIVGSFNRSLHKETQDVIDGFDAASSSGDDFAGSLHNLADAFKGTANEANAAHTALVDYARSVTDQFDPTANLIHRLQDVKTAQADYNTALHDHGPKSQQAKDADLKLAEAVIAADTAAANAAGTFNGKLPPALRATLLAGGMTEKQIHDIEVQFQRAKAAGDKFAKTYEAHALLEFSTYRAGERNPGKRAAGGPVSANQSYIVGENGPELITPSSNGYVHTASQTAAMLSGASGGSVGVSVTLNAAGAADDLKNLFLKWMRVDAGFRATVKAYVGAGS